MYVGKQWDTVHEKLKIDEALYYYKSPLVPAGWTELFKVYF
jgi:hypothetical protein